MLQLSMPEVNLTFCVDPHNINAIIVFVHLSAVKSDVSHF